MAIIPAEATEVHVVGDGGYKYAGGEWVQTAPEKLGDVSAIWAFAEDDIFVGDEDGAVFQFDGQEWECIYRRYLGHFEQQSVCMYHWRIYSL
jgi:hypothetical protein